MIWVIFLVYVTPATAQEPDQEAEPAEQQAQEEKEDKSDQKSEKKTKKDQRKGGNPIKAFLTQFTLGVSTGYGVTFYSHNLKGFGIYQPATGDDVFIFDEAFINRDTLPAVYINWVNNAQGFGGLIIPVDSLSTPIITNGIPVFPNDLKIGNDSIKIGYRSTAHSIPLTLTLSVDVDRYRIGGGVTLEFQKIGTFHPTSLKDTLRSFNTDFTLATIKKYFGFIGFTTFESWQYKMVADIQFGKINRGKHFNKNLISSGLYFNFGYTVEKSFSEYFKIFVRPSIEWKSYSMNIPETGLTLNHRQPSIFIQVGANIRLPVLSKCPVPGCRTQINHAHDGYEYRSKVHPFWKWQDPNYGQNYPQLFKYKGKGKKRLNPY
ncbi:MAG: hypothetical protein O6939_02965 [Bacteroidetes bacterium]|nr:hypothetical protein [Bacteroidota bacterium]